jgi:hypothetical protein
MVIISDIQLPKDSDGILKVSDVSTSAQGDLSARTDITNPSTSTFVKTDAVGRLNILESNIEGAGASNSLNATEYPVHQIGAFDGSAYRVAKCKSDGKLQVEIIGNTSSDGSGDSNVIHTDSNGNIRVSTVSTVNTAPANNANSGITDDPANSYAVGMRGRTNIAQSNTETFLKCDTDGHLQVDIVSGGGGGDASEATLSALNDKVSKGESDIAAGTGAQQVLIYGKDAFAPFNLEPIRMSSDKVLMTNPNITRGEGNITGGGNGLQQILAYGKDQSGNLDPLNVDSNGHLKITLNDIEAGIVNSINVASKHDNAYLQLFNNSSVAQGASIITNSHILSAGAGWTSAKNPITIYVHFGSGTSDSNFTVEVEKSYDGTIYFLESNFTFNPLGFDTQNPPVSQPAVVGNGFSDGRFIKVKITNNAEANPTSVNCYIIERQ